MKIIKKIELLSRKFINRLLISDKNPKRIEKTEFFDEFKAIEKVLFLRHDRIGDVLVSIPTFKKFRERFPQLEIHILLSDKNSGTEKALQCYCNKIHILPNEIYKSYRLIKELNREKYDLIVDMFDTVSTRSNLLLKLIKAKYKLGFDKSNSSLYTHTVPMPEKSQTHIVERILSLLSPFGISYVQNQIKIEYPLNIEMSNKAQIMLGEKKAKYRLAIVLSGSSEAKFWGVDNINNFIRLFNQKFQNFEIILFGTKKHSQLLAELSQTENLKVAPFTSILDEFAAMLSLCDYLITPDTSAVHFASAFSIPSVVMYSMPANNELMPWYPYNSPYRAVMTNEPDIKAISPEKVFEKFIDLYESTR